MTAEFENRRRFIVSLIDLTELHDADAAVLPPSSCLPPHPFTDDKTALWHKPAFHDDSDNKESGGSDAVMSNPADSDTGFSANSLCPALQRIAALCEKAQTPLGLPAALCIYRQFLPVAANILQAKGLRNKIALASVVNFPWGQGSRNEILEEIEEALAFGADEVDIVFPHKAFSQGKQREAALLLRESRRACGNKTLKVILESGALAPHLLRQAAECAIFEGADFIKTSTGKISVGATLPAARIMLRAIADHNKNCGFKASGGVRTLRQAEDYLALAAEILGEDWASPARFRFGASALLDNLLRTETSAVNSGEQTGKLPSY